MNILKTFIINRQGIVGKDLTALLRRKGHGATLQHKDHTERTKP
jgi:5,10-methylene-tetrahydrofolate dehydrogenase/methenyl tetrahydrofolate cyclohydrolase